MWLKQFHPFLFVMLICRDRVTCTIYTQTFSTKWLPYICSCVRRGHLLENLSSICRLEFNPSDVYSIQLYTEKTLLVAYTRYGEDVGWGFFFFILPSIIFPIYGLWLPFWHLQTSQFFQTPLNPWQKSTWFVFVLKWNIVFTLAIMIDWCLTPTFAVFQLYP